MFKKVLALAMSLCMVFAMSATAFATGTGSYTVTVKKDGNTAESMAQRAINGSATITQNDDGSYHVAIPVKAFDYTVAWATYDGNVTAFDVSGGSNESVTNITYSSDITSGAYATAIMEFDIATLPTVTSDYGEYKFDISLTVKVYRTSGTYNFTHPTVNADFYFA